MNNTTRRRAYRWATGLVALGYTALLLLLLVLFLWKDGRSEFKVSAVTESFVLSTTRTLRLGPTPVQLPEGTRADCAAPQLVVPAGATLAGSPLRLELQAPAGASLSVQCGAAARPVAVAQLAIVLPAMPAPGAAGSAAEPRLVLRIAGRLHLGGEQDEASPSAEIPLLRSARISVETKEFFGDAVAATSERQVDQGYRLSFLRDPQGSQEPEVEGLLLVRPQVFELVFRFSGHRAMLTPPGAGRGTGSVVAPSFLDQVKAQAQWGAIAVALALALGLLEVFRSHCTAPQDIR